MPRSKIGKVSSPFVGAVPTGGSYVKPSGVTAVRPPRLKPVLTGKTTSVSDTQTAAKRTPMAAPLEATNLLITKG